MASKVIELRVNDPSDLVNFIMAARAISAFLQPKEGNVALEVSQKVKEEVEEFFKRPENPLMTSADLLRKFGSPVSSVKFNSLAVAHGLLIVKEGIFRNYKVIPNEYLCYGKNLVSSSNQKETQPYWFESTFQEVLTKLGVTK